MQLEKFISNINTACRRHKVKKLYLFGSALTVEFDEKNSDVDVLVEMLPLAPLHRGQHLLDLWAELEQLFGKKVDLLTPDSLRNPYLKQEIERTKHLVYDQQSEKVSF